MNLCNEIKMKKDEWNISVPLKDITLIKAHCGGGEDSKEDAHEVDSDTDMRVTSRDE